MAQTKAIKMKIKKNDTVIVIAGKDKGKTGTVKTALPKENRVIVAGINMATRHVKPSQADPEGGRRQFEASIHASNVALADKTAKQPTKPAAKAAGKKSA